MKLNCSNDRSNVGPQLLNVCVLPLWGTHFLSGVTTSAEPRCFPMSMLFVFCSASYFWFITWSAWLSHHKQTTPESTWKRTQIPIFKWTRFCLFGPHQSANEFSHHLNRTKLLKETNQGSLKVDQKALVWKQPKLPCDELVTYPGCDLLCQLGLSSAPSWPCQEKLL